jgi:RNA polymerase sigma-70 factor, ECF subfamily
MVRVGEDARDAAMQQLLSRLADGEEAAFAELYDEYAPRLYRYLYVSLRSRDAADEVLQEVFVRLVRSRESLRTVRQLTAYLFTVTRHEVQRHTRVVGRHSDDQPLVADSAVSRESDPQQAWETVDEAAAALAQLSEAQREVVELKIFGELTLAEIAVTLDVAPGTIATRYRTALIRMREWLTELDRNDGDRLRPRTR